MSKNHAPAVDDPDDDAAEPVEGEAQAMFRALQQAIDEYHGR